MNQDDDNAGWAKRLREAVGSGSIEKLSRAELTECSLWLAQRGSNNAFNDSAEYEQISALVRLYLLRKPHWTSTWEFLVAVIAAVAACIAAYPVLETKFSAFPIRQPAISDPQLQNGAAKSPPSSAPSSAI